MRIDRNTTLEEVREVTKNSMVGLCTTNVSDSNCISHGIRELFENRKIFENNSQMGTVHSDTTPSMLLRKDKMLKKSLANSRRK